MTRPRRNEWPEALGNRERLNADAVAETSSALRPLLADVRYEDSEAVPGEGVEPGVL